MLAAVENPAIIELIQNRILGCADDLREADLRKLSHVELIELVLSYQIACKLLDDLRENAAGAAKELEESKQ